MYLFRKYHSRNQQKTDFNLRCASSPLVSIFFRSPRLITTSFKMGYTITSSYYTVTPTRLQRRLSKRLYLFPMIYRMQHFTTFMVMFFW
jgi:hypothetical protein